MREKQPYQKDGNRHFEGCEKKKKKKGVWWQHEKYSVGKHKFSSNNTVYEQCMIILRVYPS